MTVRTYLLVTLLAAVWVLPLSAPPTPACCPAGPAGMAVVNADQTVILLWDEATKTQHFIRKASFQSEADDFGFLVPSPAVPELEESGSAAFPYLQKVTEPEIQYVRRPSGNVGCGCLPMSPVPMAAAGKADSGVEVRAEKEVAGFHAVVLESKSADALVKWLKERGYAFSPEVAAWAKPYVEAGWMITALKVVKPKDDAEKKNVAAASLRMSFKTDRPLFPYREPDPKDAAKALGARHRLLRIYFVAEARYRGELTKEEPWTGKVAWAGKLADGDRKKALELLKLPETEGPAEWWLTEFEDDWPYRAAPADVTFSLDPDQSTVRRPPVRVYVSAPWPTDITAYAMAALVIVPPLVRRVRRGRNE
jgi:hypothetical protein